LFYIYVNISNIKFKKYVLISKILDQTFGVPIEEKAKHDLKYIPQIVTKCLSCITKGFSKWSDTGKDKEFFFFFNVTIKLFYSFKDKRLVWTTNVPLASIHSLRDKVNDGKLIYIES
jgi:hypothetical protein